MIKREFRRTPDLYPLTQVRVVDGDTIEACIILAFGCSTTRRIRLKGWWADEPQGEYRSAGLDACLKLERWVEGKVLWLHSPSCRLDRYGRVIGHLVLDEKLVDPREVLGEHQLTEAEHKRRRDRMAKAAQQAKAWPEQPGGIRTADTQSKSLLGHPRAKDYCSKDPDYPN
jgi:endonuclease YncB( thermonuclease family)